ncbi:MAG TPA: outer membrane protein assembly factor BamE [Burkholderiales bacterium]|nr:outer membrane protein assembly factor BamE [Burkholderiales bacterium]
MRLRILLAVLAIALAACSRVTQENFSRVQEGMTEQEVIAILGEPTESNSVTVLGVSGTVARWEGGGAVITVRFVNGQAALKTFDKPGRAPG